MRGNRRSIGSSYEQKAAQHLEVLGYRILERNYRCRMGEIDLIAMEDRTLVFVEVKYRSSEKKGAPQEAVGIRKQRKICRVAAWYCMCHQVPEDQPCRFDVVSICGEDIKLLRDAFMYII